MRIAPFRCAIRAALAIIPPVLLAAGARPLYAQPLAALQQPFYPAPDAPQQPPAKSKKHSKATPPDQNGPTPTLTIPVTSYGFAPPSASYLGLRIAQVSLHFLGEDQLLFTFRVPGLIARGRPADAQSGFTSDTHLAETERNIRALVLSLPSGRVTAEALWLLHDYRPYLVALDEHQFLLRDQNLLQIGDASLTLKPYLRFHGFITDIALEPSERLLITNTVEPSSSSSSASDSSVPSPTSSAANLISADTVSTAKPVTPNAASPAPAQTLLRILQRDTGKVLLWSRVAGTTRIPVDGEGYYEVLRGRASSWLIAFNHFNGATNPLASVDSTCSPALEAIAPSLVLASACLADGGRRLTAITQSQHRLWDVTTPATEIWPLLASSSGGSRFARATLEVTHPIGPSTPLDNSDIRKQPIQVYDLANGHLALTVNASPILDGGGNFALSPSGNRFAVLKDGAVQVFDLPPAPAMPVLPPAKP
jgi:hypothetical protein